MGITYQCLIVDDEKPAHQVLLSHIKQCDDLECIGHAYSGKEALTFLQSNEVDILFLDINMPLVSGLELLEMLPIKPTTIVTTAYSEFALESYQNDAVDYLLKPIAFSKFLKAVEKAKVFCKDRKENNRKSELQKVLIKEDGFDYFIEMSDIMYVESAGNYIKIFTKSRRKSYFVYGSLVGFKTELIGDNFVQVHRSFIINKECIKERFMSKVILMNGDEVPIGRKYQILLDQ
ncbi:LytR/AlgR family response regulator transcription factor [Myroides odoratimimus]|uniref:LytR/AlgR family response regulator transcription factor n=1 Tax=Myroides odoratimimus TaxID=76832 RepID=UPI00091EC60A|nr:LytTR family DNA-binding domain-containing protein [Myroides odoratimimus]MCO7723119.1 LytTR family DNA-binding domain-containing protein [Myroides odoratimimus]MCS7472171.1 LytTR family DNA-binding domain-containing protein [Myroides odoratimimus]MDM1034866.1 response regulator transcription factor [Myroides odoratimimus]MDM1038201.1 response regulator transcription factor [Myroides odoratimimus]MDM1052405.1 response regulator transcription factor [Myroides odoratimimus]